MNRREISKINSFDMSQYLSHYTHNKIILYIYVFLILIVLPNVLARYLFMYDKKSAFTEKSNIKNVGNIKSE